MNIQTIERKVHIGERDKSILTKLREMMIRKSREYCLSFPKYNRDSKQGQAWCANICYHLLDYKVEIITAEDIKFKMPGHVKRDCLEQSHAQTSYNRGPKRDFSCYNCNKKGHLARDCRAMRKKKGREAAVTQEKVQKMIQDIMVQCNKKSVDFQ